MPERERFEERIIPADADDPFGDDVIPAFMGASGGYGELRLKGTGSPFKARSHYPRAIAYLTALYGGMYWACDRTTVGFGSRILSQDLLGFMDVQGVIPDGRFLAANVTTLGQIGAHLRTYVDPNNTYSGARKRVSVLLRNFLGCGGRFVILGFYQDGGKGSKWHVRHTIVTTELLDEVAARRRGPRRAN